MLDYTKVAVNDAVCIYILHRICTREYNGERGNSAGCPLRWSDIDFEQNVLIVRKSKTRSGQGRRVDLNSMLRQTLLSLSEQEHGEWVFPSPRRFQKPGGPERHIGDVKNSFRRAVQLAGIEPITFHQLRHTFCSRLANAGVPMPVVQDLAGHASIMMTRRYTHPSSDLKKRPWKFS